MKEDLAEKLVKMRGLVQQQRQIQKEIMDYNFEGGDGDGEAAASTPPR